MNYDEQVEIYDKLFHQLQKQSINMNTKLVSRTLNILLKYKQIFKNDRERSEKITDLIQFYIERFNDSVKFSEKQVETEVALNSLDNVKALIALQKETQAKDLDTQAFFDNCLRLFEDRIDKMRPDTFIKSFDRFEDQKLKSRYVNSLLRAMRENKFDIRKFNFSQLAQVI